MCLVHVDVNIVASGCMAFARPSSAAVLGFSCIKLHTPDLEQVVQEGHNSRAQKRKDTHTKTTRHTSPQERARTDKHLKKNSKTEGSGRVQNQFKFKTTATSSSRQLQPSSKNMQQQTCYDPQLQGISCGIAILQTLLAALSSDHRCTLVQVTYNHIQDTYNTLQNHLKNRAVKTVDKLNCRTMTTEKLLQQSPMSPHVSNCMQVTSN